MKVLCEIDYISRRGDHGQSIPSVCATCTRCQNEVKSYGDGQASIDRCLVVMREECPNGEKNYYVEDPEELKPKKPKKPRASLSGFSAASFALGRTPKK
jgi:hypothetical protein